MKEGTLVPGIEKLQQAVNEAAAMHSQLASCFTELAAIATQCAEALKAGATLFFCGNGGSAAESQHLAAEFVVRLTSLRNRRALSATALTTDTSILTACANDYGFEYVFARQLEARMKPGDVLFLLSTSGQSKNLLEAAHMSRSLGGTNVAFLGKDKSTLDDLVDHALHIPSPSGQRVQEAHLLCGHVLVELVESMLFNEEELKAGTAER